MKTCLITGISGLIGAQLVQRLLPDWQIWGVTRQAPTLRPPQPSQHYISLDLAADWDSARLPAQIDAVIHLAQSEHFREFPERAENVLQINTVSTLRLLDYARRAGARSFILASSGGVYGHHEKGFCEDTVLTAKEDLGFYLGTKLCAEILAENYTPFMNVIVLRFFFVYGARQRRSMLIPRLVQSVLDGKPILLQGADGIRINPTYVSDAATALQRALTLTKSDKINIGGPEILSMRQIGETIGKVVDKEPHFAEQPAHQPRHLIGDIDKMTRLLGAPQVTFEAGIRKFLAQNTQ